MSERVGLTRFIPEDQEGVKIELREYLLPVVGRIGQILPPDKVWEFFSSTSNETGGVICFPHCRVDVAIINCRDHIELLTRFGDQVRPEKSGEWYKQASNLALTALLWVEIGFQGLENLAKSPSSRSWTALGVGHFVTDEERKVRIMTKGAKSYRDYLGEFVAFRTQKGITEDCFTQYRVEYLLDGFRATCAGNV